MLVASKAYEIPVLVVAVAIYVTLPAAWHRVEVVPILKTGKPTVGVTLTL
jgi:hypothetical protein